MSRPGWGGKRKGAGGPKGKKHAKTLKRLEEEALIRAMVAAEIGPMTMAQIESAKGFKYLMVRQRHGGKFVRVTEAMAKAKLGSDEEVIEVWEKDPDTEAFRVLLDRAYGRPGERVNVEHSGGVRIVVELPE